MLPSPSVRSRRGELLDASTPYEKQTRTVVALDAERIAPTWGNRLPASILEQEHGPMGEEKRRTENRP